MTVQQLINTLQILPPLVKQMDVEVLPSPQSHVTVDFRLLTVETKEGKTIFAIEAQNT